MISKETLSLLRRLQSGIGRWPVNSSRKGRDLGGFLRTTYEQRFKELVKTDPVKAEEVVRSLERLVSDHHRKLYSRDKNYSVLSEEEVPIEKIASEILSTEAQKRKPQKTLWERMKSLTT